jgi:hypothetical protein
MSNVEAAALFLSTTFHASEWIGKNKKESKHHFGLVVSLLQKFPCLLSQEFCFDGNCTRRDVYLMPLQLLLLSQNQVTLELVQQVHAACPLALTQMGRYYAEELNYSYYPLYLACLQDAAGSSKDTDKKDLVIQYMADNINDKTYNPRCLAVFRRLFQLQHNQLSLRATKILLHKYPDLATVEYSGGRILDLAFHSGYANPVLQYILHKTPRKSLLVRAPSALNSDQIQALQHSLLPFLTTLAWETHSSHTLLLLLTCLQGNTSVKNLNLAIQGTLDQTFIATLQALLATDQLEVLGLETTSEIPMEPLLRTLRHNRNLKVLGLNPPISELATMKLLLETLELDNMGLQQVTLAPSLRKYSTHKHIEYYLQLNQCGRSLARDTDTSLHVLVQLLNKVTTKASHKNRHRILYGMLRESPSLWLGIGGA